MMQPCVELGIPSKNTYGGVDGKNYSPFRESNRRSD